jgi:hypothetical protein
MDVQLTQGGRNIKTGFSDPECHRARYRQALGHRLLVAAGVEPIYLEHSPDCIQHPDNRHNRVFGHNYHCDTGCPRAKSDGEYPIWPEWVTNAMFNHAHALASEVQSERGSFHRAAASHEKAERERLVAA